MVHPGAAFPPYAASFTLSRQKTHNVTAATIGTQPAIVIPRSNEPVWSISRPKNLWVGAETSQAKVPNRPEIFPWCRTESCWLNE